MWIDTQTERLLELLHSKNLVVLVSDEHIFFIKCLKPYHFLSRTE
jgi:hypothetical protein